ncbi:MAG: hypothetical protein Q8L55_10560 [Phycisphaerales bacterium]|nr:hypothetical protein [Phycisphaerales bacterium]
MHRAATLLFAATTITVAGFAAQPAPTPAVAPPTQPAGSTPAKPFDALTLRLRATLDQAAAGGDFAAAAATVGGLWDWTCVNVPADQPEVILEVASAQRMMGHLAKYTGDRKALLAFLRASPRLANALAFQISGNDADEPAGALAVLDTLRAKFPAAQLESFANLTAAICVVYDKPVVKQVNENKGEGVSAAEAFQFYTTFESRMVFPPRTMPVELLVYTVDPGAKLDELAWALNRYGGQRDVAPRYSEISYDNDHFKRGKEKKVTTEGFNLFNIKKYGGICADQAHFSSTVGKAIGVPAAVAAGQGSGVAHAWLGYLKKQGRRVEWNFDAGRYNEYEDIRGTVTDPQTGAQMPDGTLALTAESIDVPDAARQASTAFVDAALRLRKITGIPAPMGIEIAAKLAARSGSADDRLALLQAGLTLYSANHSAWNTLRAMASAKELSLEQKKAWAASLQRLCGERYPDFTLAVLIPMVSTIDDVAQQGAMWEAIYKGLRFSRPDLAAEVLIEEGKMWDKADAPDKAYNCFTSAAYQFISKSPASVEALERCETMLQKRHAQGEVLTIYANAWKRLAKPKDMAREFLAQSNWHRVGTRYAELLDADGQGRKAEQVRKALGEDQQSIDRRDRQQQKDGR